MNQHLFILMIFTGVVPFVLSDTHRYYLVNQTKTWAKAQTYCQATYTDLAIIESNDDMVQLQNEAQRQQFNSNAWVGMYNDVHSWRWSLGIVPLGNMAKWVPGQPNNYDGNQTCGVLIPKGFDDRHCLELRPFLCVDELENGTNRYIYSSNTVTWFDAQSYCRQYYTDLASTSTEAEYLIVAALVTPYTWFGLFRDAWKWVDKTNVDNSIWMSGKPDNAVNPQNCGYINNGQAIDAKCSNMYPFFCYKVTKKQQIIKLKVQSNQDVNGLKASILDMIKQKLTDKGMTQNIMVNWKVHSDGAVFHKDEE